MADFFVSTEMCMLTNRLKTCNVLCNKMEGKFIYLQESEGAKRSLERHLSVKLSEDYPIKEIIGEVQKMATKANIPEHEVVILVSLTYFILFPFFLTLVWRFLVLM